MLSVLHVVDLCPDSHSTAHSHNVPCTAVTVNGSKRPVTRHSCVRNLIEFLRQYQPGFKILQTSKVTDLPYPSYYKSPSCRHRGSVLRWWRGSWTRSIHRCAEFDIWLGRRLTATRGNERRCTQAPTTSFWTAHSQPSTNEHQTNSVIFRSFILFHNCRDAWINFLLANSITPVMFFHYIVNH